MAEDDQVRRSALKRVAVALKEAGIPFALGGGYATWARGGPEPQHDVDFMILPDDVERAVDVLEKAGLTVERPPEDWLAKVYDGDILIDLVHHPNNRPVTQEMLDRCDELEVDSVYMPVMDATDLLLSKLLALTENALDLGKVLAPARALREQVDWDRVRRECEPSPYAQSFLFLAERLGVVAPAKATAA